MISYRTAYDIATEPPFDAVVACLVFEHIDDIVWDLEQALSVSLW